MTNPEKTRVQRALEHMTLTTEQSRKAAVGGQVGGSVGALTGTVTGAAIGATTAYASRGRLNRVIGTGERGSKQVKAARKKLKDLKTPSERATTGAFLGAGSGTALGGGAGAAGGLYSGRPKKARDGDGDGRVNEGKVKKVYETEDGTPFSQRVGETNRQMAARFDRSSRSADAVRKPYNRKAGEAAIGGAATAAVLRRRAPRAALAAGAAGLIGAGAISGTGSAKHRKTLRDEMSKAYDESKHRRDRGKFAPRSGMTEAPGARKPGMSPEKKKKALANSVAALGVAGSVADAAALKAGWSESKNTVKPTLAPDATRRTRTLARAKYVAGKGSFPLQVVGLGAGLGGSYFARQAGKTTKEKAVAKSFEEITKDAQAFRYDKKTGQRRRNAYTNPTPGQAGVQGLTGAAGTLAGLGAGAKAVGKVPELAGKVNAEATKRVLNGKMGVKTGLKTVKAANKIGHAAKRPNATLAGAAVGAIAAGGATVRGTAAVQNHGTTTKKRVAKSAPSVDEVFAKAREYRRGANGQFTSSAFGHSRPDTAAQAGAVGAGLVGVGAVRERRGQRKLADAGVARRNAHVLDRPGSEPFSGGSELKNAIEAENTARKGRRMVRGGRGNAFLGGVSLGLAGLAYAGDKKKTVQKSAPTQETAMPAPDVNELFAKARQQKEYSPAAGAAGGVAGGLGTMGATSAAIGSAKVNARTAESTSGAEQTKAVSRARRNLKVARALNKPSSVAIGAGLGSAAAMAATARDKKVTKSFDTAEEVFGEVAKFERETKRAAKTGAKIGGTLGAIGGGTQGAILGGVSGGRKGAIAGAVGGATAAGAVGAANWGVLGAGVGALKARKRQKIAAATKTAV